jgi:hypothetical protein
VSIAGLALLIAVNALGMLRVGGDLERGAVGNLDAHGFASFSKMTKPARWRVLGVAQWAD